MWFAVETTAKPPTGFSNARTHGERNGHKRTGIP